jgi:hypothetical protein
MTDDIATIAATATAQATHPVVSTAARASRHLLRTIIVETEQAKWINRLSTKSPTG